MTIYIIIYLIGYVLAFFSIRATEDKDEVNHPSLIFNNLVVALFSWIVIAACILGWIIYKIVILYRKI